MTVACFGMSVGAFPDAERAGLSECPLGGAAIDIDSRFALVSGF